jgi:DnaA family protein
VVDERGRWSSSTVARNSAPRPSSRRSSCSSLAGNGVQWAAAGRLPPVDLPLREDLRTRLGWGHVFALHPLSEAETRAALRRQAEERGIFLSDEVMDHVLTRQSRDLGNLMGLLDRLDRFSLARSRPITIPLLRRMLQEEDVEFGALGVTP